MHSQPCIFEEISVRKWKRSKFFTPHGTSKVHHTMCIVTGDASQQILKLVPRPSPRPSLYQQPHLTQYG